MPLAVALLLFVAFAGGGALLVRAGWGDLRSGWRSRRWPRVDGLIDGVEEVGARVPNAGRGLEYRVRYSYVVAGRLETGRWSSLISTRHRAGGCPFKAGDLVGVYVDPAEAGRSRLFRGPTWQDAFVFLGGAVFLVGAGLPLLVYAALRPD